MYDTKIEMKIHEEIKPLEEVCKKMMEEFAASIDNTDESAIPVAGQITDMIKDLCEAKEKIAKACYYKYILGQMEKTEEEEKEEEKLYLRMIKEEHKDELNRMREEYGEDEGERRFYDNYRYKTTGRFAPKGRGTRRGYAEPMYYMPLEMYGDCSPEELRGMDRMSRERLYYTGGGSYSSNSGGNSNNSYSGRGNSSGGNSGSNSGSSRGYSEGFNDGEESGYQRGYSDGRRSGSRSGSRDGREGRSGQSRRSYMESKEMNKGNTPEEKRQKMTELEKYMGELSGDISEMISDASQEEKNLLKQKLTMLTQKIN